MKEDTNPQMELAWEFVQRTHQNIFLTGKAGTGKTTFLHRLRESSPKRMIVVAPTGVAAINAAGVTIHSFFQVSFGPQIPVSARLAQDNFMDDNRQAESKIRKMSREKIAIMRSLDLLVIDEISMVRADLLDAVDSVLRQYKDRSKPFGGVQLLMIGDLQQLAPVVKDEDWEILGKYYGNPFFFSSLALKQATFITIELRQIYRQKNQEFIDILNRIRNNQTDSSTLRKLNSRYMPDFMPGLEEGYIVLTTHNHQAKTINQDRLDKLVSREIAFQARTEGDFPEFLYPTDSELTLKKDAQVMFVKNDPSPAKRFYNGKIGRITAIDEEGIEVLCPGDMEPVLVTMEEWQNIRYTVDEETKEIREEVTGTFIQYPLKLAWAITIHKSQGLTFDKAIIDARSSFAHGQVYVALSRCRSLEGIVLRSPLSEFSIKSDGFVREFAERADQEAAGSDDLNRAKIIYQQQLLAGLFDFRPLVKQMNRAVKFCQEHKEEITGDYEDVLMHCINNIREKIIPVSERFMIQLKDLTVLDPDAEKNIRLQDRLRKAAGWYLDEMENLILKPLGKATFDAENRVVKKGVLNGMERISGLLAMHKACMQLLPVEFNVYDFLAVKARTALEPVKLIGQSAGSKISVKTTLANPDLYRKLFEWRREVAEADGVGISKILTLKTMKLIVTSLPVSRAELRKIHGIGKTRLNKYGDKILNMVTGYMVEHNIEMADSTRLDLPGSKKRDSKTTTLELFREGKSVTKIAAERGLSKSTIESHLAYFVGAGELGLEGLVDPVKMRMIAAYITKNSSATLSEAREELGSNFSFGELRMVREFMKVNTFEEI
jgi:nucleoside-triphosphatase THEP1